MSEQITREMLKALTDEQINGMNKSNLQLHLIAAVQWLNTAPEKNPGRKEDVLEILRKGPASILEIAEKLNIQSKNVSSQLSYLRKDGWVIHTDDKQRKYLAASAPVVHEETPEDVAERTADMQEVTE